MAAWGYGGLENDAALELSEGFILDIRRKLKKPFTCGDESRSEDIRAAAELAIRLYDCGVFIDEDTINLAVDQIESILDCGFSMWPEPRRAERETLGQLRRLAAIRNRMRRRRNPRPPQWIVRMNYER